jgi:NAD(P)-dependent dehydrogenase (short-subunit alcohol dehydrogenase family)
VSFKGVTALVTGGAHGLGRAVALAFGRQGASVAIADLDEKAAHEVACEIRKMSVGCCVICADVSAPGRAYEIVGRTVDEFGRLDILVNNAGTWSVQPLLGITEEEWTRVFDVNVKGLLFCLQAAARHMKENGGGKIINISSPASRMGLPGYAAYAASKAAVDSITRSAAAALGPYGITVNCVAPGRMDTGMQQNTERLFAELEGTDVKTFVENRTSTLPLRRRTSPEEVAEAILWLASRTADYMTGARLNISGGLELN